MVLRILRQAVIHRSTALAEAAIGAYAKLQQFEDVKDALLATIGLTWSIRLVCAYSIPCTLANSCMLKLVSVGPGQRNSREKVQ